MLRFLFVVLLLIPLPSLAGETVTFVNDPWPPYVMGDEANGQPATEGISVAIVNQIFARIDGVDARILLTPWRKSLHGVEQGYYDAIALLFKTPKREAYMEFSNPVFSARTVFYYRAADFPEGVSWDSIQDLERYKIAVQHSFSIAEFFDQQIEQGVALNLIKMNEDKECFRLLQLGRVDMVATNEVAGREIAKQLGQSGKIIATRQSLYEKPYYLGFSKKTKARELIPQINRIIGELRAEGEIEKVLAGSVLE